MYCSRRRVLACAAYARDRCNGIDTLHRNHVHNKLTEGRDPAHSLDANVTHSTKNRSDLSDNASYVSRAKGTNFVPAARFREWVSIPVLITILKLQLIKCGKLSNVVSYSE